jgi:dipeptidyl aminopeptidase/acylaminoacyl peptidase
MLATVIRIAVGAAVAYGLVVVVTWRFQERIALPGSTGRLTSPAEAGFRNGRTVEITTPDGVRLRGWYLSPPPSPTRWPGLLWFYGNMETVSGLAPVIRRMGPTEMALLVLDYRGYGESEGRSSEATLYADAETAWTWLTQQPEVDATRVAVYGRSIGSVPALYLAASRSVCAVVLDSPFSNAAEMARLHYPFLPRAIMHFSMNNLVRAARITAPLLVFHGTEDDIAPLAMGRAVAEAGHARELVLIKGAGHNETYDRGSEAYRDKLQAFLREGLGVAPSRGP